MFCQFFFALFLLAVQQLLKLIGLHGHQTDSFAHRHRGKYNWQYVKRKQKLLVTLTVY